MHTCNNTDDTDEVCINSSMISTCCGAMPIGYIDEHNCGICSECHDHTIFEKDIEDECQH